MRALRLYASALLLTVFGLGFPAAAEPLAISTSNSPPYANAQESGFQDVLVREAFNRIGRTVTFHHVQTERAIVNVNMGVDDANLVRVAGLESLYPNIRRVPEALFGYDFIVFARQGLFEPDGWSSLAPYRVAFIRGWKILEKNVRSAREIKRVIDEQHLFERLREGSTDIVIYERWRGEHILKIKRLTNIAALEPPLIQRPMYIYLHKRHEDLIKPLAIALKAMKTDGTYDQAFNGAMRPYMQK